MNAGWKTVNLGEILSVQNGYAFDSKFFGTSGMPLIRIRDIKHGTTTETSYSGDYDEAYVVHSGDYLIGMDGEFRCYMWHGTAALLNQRVCRLTNFSPNVLPAFVCYGINKYLKEIEDVTGYSTVKHLSSKSILSIQFPLPPLAEQKRIVALLDEAFAGIDEAKAKAVDNVLGAKRAFQSILETSLSPTAAGWTERKLDDLCVIKGRIGYRGYTKNDLVEKGQGAITLSPSNIKQNRFVADDCTYISWFKYNESPEIMIFEGDILFVKTGSTFGKVAIAKDLPEKATINPQFVVLKEMQCNNWFLYYSMTSNTFREKVEGIVGGAATPTLSQANLGELTIHVPPIRIQETIVNQLDAAHEATTSLGNLYEQKIKSIRELRASLLAQAFAGKLTA
jgi:type I restriction enzyme S subunit